VYAPAIVASQIPSSATNTALVDVMLDDSVSLETFSAAVRGRCKIEIGLLTELRVARSEANMHACIARDAVVYGITTGFGPLANRLVPKAHVSELQRNLIYHLASGVGAPLAYAEARGLMLARLISMTRGYSAASPNLVRLMARCLEAGLAPVVPEKGTVGASGDLTPSAHMALALMGEGAFLTMYGERLEGAAGLELNGLTPYTLDSRDGLALVNGTSAMTAIAGLNAIDAARATDWAVALSAMHAEVMGGRTEAWHPTFAMARPHPGQQEAIRRLNWRIAGSERLDRSNLAARTLPSGTNIETEKLPTQDPYTIRCVPQIIGAVLDVLEFHHRIVETELNSVTDNPLFEDDAPHALHGGNFYGQHVAFASDALMPAIIKLAILAERQIARVTDETLSKGLPAFLQPNATGLHSGFMGAQVTASALLAEMRTRAIPASIQSISTNGNNQDVVSMGTIGARNVRDIMIDVFHVLAIQALVLTQAQELRLQEDQAQFSSSEFSAATTAVASQIRAISPALKQDRPLARDIELVAQLLRSQEPRQ
jgi:tyrosine ammonia-lyase